MTHVDTAKNQNLKLLNNINSCYSFNSICSSKIGLTFLQLNKSRNNKLRFACCNKSQKLLMYAKFTEYKPENEFMFYYWT